MLNEPLKFLGTIKELIWEVTPNDNIDIILTIKVSDSKEKKTEVFNKLTDTKAMEYFEIIIKNEGKSE